MIDLILEGFKGVVGLGGQQPIGSNLDRAQAAGEMVSMAGVPLAAMKPIKGSLTLYRGVRQPGAAHLRGRQGGKVVSDAMQQAGERGAFFSRNPEIAKLYQQDAETGLPSPGGGIWVTRANKKDAPPHWMSRMWGESSHIVDVDKQRGKLRFIPSQDAWRSPHAEDAIRRRAEKELSGAADEARKSWASRRAFIEKYGIAAAVSAGLIGESQARQLKEQGYK